MTGRDEVVGWLREAIAEVNGWTEAGPAISGRVASRMLFAASGIRCRRWLKVSAIIAGLMFFPISWLSGAVVSLGFDEAPLSVAAARRATTTIPHESGYRFLYNPCEAATRYLQLPARSVVTLIHHGESCRDVAVLVTETPYSLSGTDESFGTSGTHSLEPGTVLFLSPQTGCDFRVVAIYPPRGTMGRPVTATTSAQLAGVLTDEADNGTVIFDTGPTTISPRYEVFTETVGGEHVVDFTTGSHQVITLRGTMESFDWRFPDSASILTARICQDFLGNNRVEFPSKIQWVGGFEPRISMQPNTCTILSFRTVSEEIYGSYGAVFDSLPDW
jgi:hypothetical protein